MTPRPASPRPTTASPSSTCRPPARPPCGRREPLDAAGVIQGLVSTVIPVHNRPDLLREAVSSVLAQTHRPIEIIVVDDGSTDRTPEVCAALRAQASDLIRVIRIDQAGPGAAREAG